MVIAQFPPFGGVSFVKLTNEGILTNQLAKDESPFSSNEELGIRLFSILGEDIESSSHWKKNRDKSNKIIKEKIFRFFITFTPNHKVAYYF
jgi:hypothetical protein